MAGGASSGLAGLLGGGGSGGGGVAGIAGAAAGATPYGAIANVAGQALKRSSSLTDRSQTTFGAINLAGVGSSNLNLGQMQQDTNSPWWVGGLNGGSPPSQPSYVPTPGSVGGIVTGQVGHWALIGVGGLVLVVLIWKWRKG